MHNPVRHRIDLYFDFNIGSIQRIIAPILDVIQVAIINILKILSFLRIIEFHSHLPCDKDIST